jgi:hypothetical protein
MHLSLPGAHVEAGMQSKPPVEFAVQPVEPS